MDQQHPESAGTQPPREHKEMLDGKHFPILSGMADINLHVLNGASHVMHVSKGVEVLHEGDTPHDLYFVLKGKLSVIKRFNEKPRVLAHLHTGDVYGEFGLVRKKPRYASVFTDTPSRIVRVDTAAALQVLEADRVFRYQLNQLLKFRKLASFFSVHPVFRELPMAIRNEFAEALPICLAERGERVFSQGDRPAGIFIILSGEAEVRYTNPGGVEMLLDIRRDSDMLGELIQKHGKSMAYTAIAASNLDMLIMNQGAMRLLKKRHAVTAKYLDDFIHKCAEETLKRLKENPG